MQAAPQIFSHYPASPAPVRVSLTTIPDHPCPYHPERTARSRAMLVGEMPPEVYHDFMDAGFRRSGRIVYQPVCRTCRDCMPIRVDVDRFRADKSQRRCWRRNADLQVAIETPAISDEKYVLYSRYLNGWHGREAQGSSREDFEQFLYESPVKTIEFTYRDPAGRLLAVGICDLCDASLSSVYCFFDPEFSDRGLGTYAALREIEFARSSGIRHYYLGYWVRGCKTMHYKSNFRPFELLGSDAKWRENEFPVG
jgi:arginine-tRNA-protein transferase